MEDLTDEEKLDIIREIHEVVECMREGCREERFEDSVLCKDHTDQVLRGEAKAPPLRRGIDYHSIGRKTFLVENLCGFPVKDE